MITRIVLFPAVIGGALLAIGCASVLSDSGQQAREPSAASPRAVFVDFDFAGVFYTSDNSSDASLLIRSQLRFTMGQLNHFASLGRVDEVQLTNLTDETVADPDVPNRTWRKLGYHARMPVAWGWQGSEAFDVVIKDVPPRFILKLPRTGDFQWFVDRYYQVPLQADGLPDDGAAGNGSGGDRRPGPCLYAAAHDVSTADIWFWYRPDQEVCPLRDTLPPTASTPEVEEDPQRGIVRLKATVTPNWTQTVSKYPEYDKVWGDRLLKVVGVVGRVKAPGDTSWPPDTGPLAYADYNKKIQELLQKNGAASVEVAHEDTPERTTIKAAWVDGTRFESLTMLVDSLKDAQSYYSQATADADLVAYSGHSGLGQHIRDFGRWGKWQPGQYTIALLSGCDSFAYIDDTLWQARRSVNPDDPTGRKYLDVIVNLHPATSYDGTNGMLEVAKRLFEQQHLGRVAGDDESGQKRPATYEEILAKMSSFAVPVVIGEEDNAFAPEEGDLPEPWDGFDFPVHFKYKRLHQLRTPVLPPNAANEAYFFCISGTGGDVDLSVRVGISPDGEEADCNPQRHDQSASFEQCRVRVTNPAPILVNLTAAQAGDFKVQLLAGGPLSAETKLPCPPPEGN